MRRITSSVAAVVLLAAAVPLRAQAPQGPAFDCTKASGQVEQLICKDAELGALDRRMADVYAKALKEFPADVAKEQRVVQRGWVKGRDDCWKADDVKGCVTGEYRSRIVELQIKSGQLQVPTPVEYACAGGDVKAFTVTFYQASEPPAAVLTTDTGDQVMAFLSQTASGAKYTAANVEFWEHHGEATVTWFGTKLACKAAGK